jgi:hypothetical protein
MADREFRQQLLEPFAPGGAVGFADFKDGQDVVLDRQPRKIDISCGR